MLPLFLKNERAIVNNMISIIYKGWSAFTKASSVWSGNCHNNAIYKAANKQHRLLFWHVDLFCRMASTCLHMIELLINGAIFILWPSAISNYKHNAIHNLSSCNTIIIEFFLFPSVFSIKMNKYSSSSKKSVSLEFSYNWPW